MSKDTKKSFFDLFRKERRAEVPKTADRFCTDEPEEAEKPIKQEPEAVSYGLSEVQALYLYGLNRKNPGEIVPPHICFELKYPHLDAKRLERAILQVLHRHPMMHTAFGINHTQMVLPLPDTFHLDVTACEPEALRETLDRQWEAVCEPSYRPKDGNLFTIRLTNCGEESYIDSSVALLTADWSSIYNLVRDTEQAYLDPESLTERLPLNYSQFVTYEEKKRRTLEYMKDNAYWEDRMNSLCDAPKLPVREAETENGDHNAFRQYSMMLSRDEWDHLRQMGEKKGFSPRSLLMSAYADALAAWSDNKSFALQLIMLKRPDMGYGTRELVGNFASHILIHADRSAGKTFVDGNRQIKQAIFEGVEHKSFSAIALMKRMKEEGKRTGLIPYVFTDMLGLMDSETGTVHSELTRYMIREIPQVYINCQAFDGKDGLGLHWDIRKDLFADEVADGLFASFEGLIRALCVDPSAWDFRDMLLDFSGQAGTRRFSASDCG